VEWYNVATVPGAAALSHDVQLPAWLDGDFQSSEVRVLLAQM
jgi:hypothetical protein